MTKPSRKQNATPEPKPRRPANAWLAQHGNLSTLDGFALQAQGWYTDFAQLQDGDGMVITDLETGLIRAFARIYRVRRQLNQSVVYFDSIVTPQIELEAALAELPVAPQAAALTRLDWTSFANALRGATGLEFSAMPIIAGQKPLEQAYIRELEKVAVVDDLLGPADGPGEEIVEMSVRERYVVGRLAPHNTKIKLVTQTQATDTDETDPDNLHERQGISSDPGQEFPKVSGTVTPDDEPTELDASANHSLIPSSMGITFCVHGNTTHLEVEACWGRYERRDSEEFEKLALNKETNRKEPTGKMERVWKRIPSGGQTILLLDSEKPPEIAVDQECPAVLLKTIVRPAQTNGDKIITIFLINTQKEPDEGKDAAWLFQPEIIVRTPENAAVFQRRPMTESNLNDPELKNLEMIYRNQVEFAVGHCVSVTAKVSQNDKTRATQIRSTWIPEYEVPVTETPGLRIEDRTEMRRMVEQEYLDMHKLGTLDLASLVTGLQILTNDYRNWIAEQQARIGHDVLGFDDSANTSLQSCQRILERLEKGIQVLETNHLALEAFRFSNLVMAAQRVRSQYALQRRRGNSPTLESLDTVANRSWRPFQLAFLLLAIPALSDPTHPDRTDMIEAEADLLWFPTGGGKTEAYLGVAAFTMAIRRLQNNLGDLDSSRGLGVIMRYTLRLLTLQQFQRASTLMCAMEVQRRANPAKWGVEPFTVGLWVGQKTTPNTTEESHSAIQKDRDGQRGTGSTPAQLTTCPWCGSKIESKRDVRIDRDTTRTIIYCGDPINECDFSKAKSQAIGLPVQVVDEEIYRRPPSMLIATVDKFALMAWNGEIRTLFGKVSQECPRHGLLWADADCTGNHQAKGTLPVTKVRQIKPIRPPDLIIQDEFHLISGPLGTMVGLYETAVDELSSWKLGDLTVHPKVIASTATIRKADSQVSNVFLRQVSVFPPSGLDVADNFFSVQRPTQQQPGRLYLGVCSPGTPKPAMLIRVYVALLNVSQDLFERFGESADPYMTLVGYFNSLRELGGMRRLCEDDVTTRSYRVLMSRIYRPGMAQRKISQVDELTSRVSSRDIPEKLDRLEVKFKPTAANTNLNQKPLDIMLATNMLSVGVDVNRLGLMVVNGQPKTTAEYIQATSRVGRSFPGLVITVLAWSRPRDLSHFENFEHYHATFYQHVEAQSVTPFAARALDRGLMGTLISLVRLHNDPLNHNLGAGVVHSVSNTIEQASENTFKQRAGTLTGETKVVDLVSRMIKNRFDSWKREAIRPGRQLGYNRVYGPLSGTVVAMLKRPSASQWDEMTVPMSLREVEPGVRLIMDTVHSQHNPDWQASTAPEDELADLGDEL